MDGGAGLYYFSLFLLITIFLFIAALPSHTSSLPLFTSSSLSVNSWSPFYSFSFSLPPYPVLGFTSLPLLRHCPTFVCVLSLSTLFVSRLKPFCLIFPALTHFSTLFCRSLGSKLPIEIFVKFTKALSDVCWRALSLKLLQINCLCYQ